MKQLSKERSKPTGGVILERDAAPGHWIGSSFDRLLQLRGAQRDGIQPSVKIDSVWTALGSLSAQGAPPVTIVKWRVVGIGERGNGDMSN